MRVIDEMAAGRQEGCLTEEMKYILPNLPIMTEYYWASRVAHMHYLIDRVRDPERYLGVYFPD